MTVPFDYIWRHPRRAGFAVFNLFVLVAVVAWMLVSPRVEAGGIASLPNFSLGTTAVTVLVIAWAASWIAWAVMVLNRRRRLALLGGEEKRS